MLWRTYAASTRQAGQGVLCIWRVVVVGPDAQPLRITPPRYVVHDIDALADAIAAAIAPFDSIALPAVVVKRWLTVRPASWG